MRRRLDAGSAGRNGDWRRRPDIGLTRRHVGPTGLYVDRRRRSVGQARFDQRIIWCRPIGVDIGECGPGQSFRRLLAARLLLDLARIGLCVLARRQRFRVLYGLTRGLRDGSVGILPRRWALLVDSSGRSRAGSAGGAGSRRPRWRSDRPEQRSVPAQKLAWERMTGAPRNALAHRR
jgi:hypothetical protein